MVNYHWLYRINSKIKLVKLILLWLFSVFIPVDSCYAGKLNLAFLQGGGKIKPSEMSSFDGRYIPGKYLVDIYLNKDKKGKQLLDINKGENNGLCFSSMWLEKAGVLIDENYYSQFFNESRKCYLLSHDKNTFIDVDFSEQALDFSIPKRGLRKQDRKIDDWNYGTSALRLDYNVNGNINSYDTSIFASSSIKLNLEKWLLTTTASATKYSIDVPIATATRAIKTLGADLVVGKTYVNNASASSSGLLGIGINSNSRMSHDDLGYSPIFSGIARTYARVTLMQNNNVIYSEIVPPGPFDIDSVRLFGSGDVTMTITESDGKMTSQLYPITIMPNMLNPGRWEYGFATGVRDSGNEQLDGLVGIGALGYGFRWITAKSSMLYHPKYNSAALVLSRGLGKWGAVTLESMSTRSRYDDGTSKRGGYVSVSYSKTWSNNTSLYINGSEYGNDYIDFSSFTPWESKDSYKHQPKYQYNFGVSHYLSERLSFGGTTWVRNYRSEQGKEVGINGRASLRFDRFNLSLGATYSVNQKVENHSFALSISLPLSVFDQDYHLYSDVNFSDNGRPNYSAGVSGSHNKWDYSLSSGWESDRNMTYAADVGYRGDRAALSGHIYQSGQSTSGSASLVGSIIALPTENDVIFTRNLTDTIAVVHIDDTEGVKFTSSPYLTNGRGNAVIPLSGYENNRITLDGKTLPLDTELLSTYETVTPIQGAVVYIPLSSVKVRRYLFQIRQKNGKFIADGTWATTDSGIPLGFIAQDGVLFISTVEKPKGIKLGDCEIYGTNIKDTTELQEVYCEK
ncbi:TPA: fimbria/pilus outer membrane usher protein [Photobacterium damselae]